jgi:hypothetical protein
LIALVLVWKARLIAGHFCWCAMQTKKSRHNSTLQRPGK